MVFGKDRASGGSAQDTDKANAINASGSNAANTGRVGSDNLSPDGHNEGERYGTPDNVTDSVHSNAVDIEGKTMEVKKRKRGDSLGPLIDVIAKLKEDTNARLDRLSARIGYKFDVIKARKEVFQIMGTIPGFTLSQVFIASDVILAKGERLDYFMSLPAAARQAYVLHALDHYIIG